MVYNSITNNLKLIKMGKNEDSVKRLENKIVDYIDGHALKEGILRPTTKTKEIKMTNTKRFHNCLYLILGLSKCQRLLMDWLSEEMDDDNMIISDEHMRSKFIKFISSINVEGKKLSYSDQTVANAFSDLANREDLLMRKAKGRYRINPEYYWRGNDEDRINAIMMQIQFDSENTNFKITRKANEYVWVKKTKVKP